MTSSFEIRRLNNGLPIISKATFGNAPNHGKSINSPSVIRVPEWVQEEDKADPTARYYCYFGDHKGTYIRMAWAATIEGPWTLFLNPQQGRGVLDQGKRDIQFTNGHKIRNHVSSPHVLVEAQHQRVLMFFHVGSHTDTSSAAQGPKTEWFHTGKQVTLVATSRTGLNFNGGSHVTSGGGEEGVDLTGEGFGIKPTPLGNAYFHVFIVHERYYAFTNMGSIWAGPPVTTPPWNHTWTHQAWPKGTLVGDGNPVWDNLHANFLLVGGAHPPRYHAGSIKGDQVGAPRHFATRYLTDPSVLEVYYTCRGDMPERIFRTSMNVTSQHYLEWTTAVNHPNPDVHTEILRPEQPWEGALHPLTLSTNGAETDTNALRDPFIFVDDDKQTYLFYSGNPESAIGVALLNNLPTSTLEIFSQPGSVTAVAHAEDTDGFIAHYSWDWGDGASSQDDTNSATGTILSTSTGSHAYQAPGNYTITLTVTDNVGGVVTVSDFVLVEHGVSNNNVIDRGLTTARKEAEKVAQLDIAPTPAVPVGGQYLSFWVAVAVFVYVAARMIAGRRKSRIKWSSY